MWGVAYISTTAHVCAAFFNYSTVLTSYSPPPPPALLRPLGRELSMKADDVSTLLLLACFAAAHCCCCCSCLLLVLLLLQGWAVQPFFELDMRNMRAKDVLRFRDVAMPPGCQLHAKDPLQPVVRCAVRVGGE